jgi:hypothetical protein
VELITTEKGQLMARATGKRTAKRPAKRATATYSEGSGFDAGNVAPSTKYVDGTSGKIVSKEPSNGGWVVVAEGDTVSPLAAKQIADGKVELPGGGVQVVEG